MAEQLADGLATETERAAALAATQNASKERGADPNPYKSGIDIYVSRAAELTLAVDDLATWASHTLSDAARAEGQEQLMVGGKEQPAGDEFRRLMQRLQVPYCDILRCIMGNPFRPVAISPEWLTSTVVALAAGIYEEQAFDRAPILADALEDAGCTDEEVLNHLRGPDVHARGCWVVDLVLAKK